MTFVGFRMLNHSGFGLIHLECLLLAWVRLASDFFFLHCPCVVLVPKSSGFIDRGGKELFLFLF